VSAAPVPFSIATIALVDGARIGICRMPGRSGDLASDVVRIAQWGAACVVSMTETDEMVAKGAAGLSAVLLAHNLDWRHFPIRDFGAPEADDRRWLPLSAELHQYLDRDEGVLLHCMGGLGRSGMVAMRLMVERGIAAQAALEAVRQVRPGAVETDAQAQWAATGIDRQYRGLKP
jgi:hypothetical protein